jgi:hypothetical protein
LLDWAHRKHPRVRRAIWALPERFQPAPEPTTWVLAVDGSGGVVADLQTSAGGYRMVTGVREHGDRIYLGSLTERAVAVVPWPAA